MPALYYFDAGTAQSPPPGWLPTAAEMGLGRYIVLPRVVGGRNLVGMHVHGDCQAPAICDGDIAIVDHNEKPAHGRYAWITMPAGPGRWHFWLKRLERRRGRWHFMLADGSELVRRPGMSIRGIVVAWLRPDTGALHIEPWADTRHTSPDVLQ